MANMSTAHFEFLAQTLGEVVEALFSDEDVLSHIAPGDTQRNEHHLRCIRIRLTHHLDEVFGRRLKTTSDRFDPEAFRRRLREECYPPKK